MSAQLLVKLDVEPINEQGLVFLSFGACLALPASFLLHLYCHAVGPASKHQHNKGLLLQRVRSQPVKMVAGRPGTALLNQTAGASGLSKKKNTPTV
jgi:hypothetical protein